MLAKIKKTFSREDNELWHEAVVEGRLSFTFRAPPDIKLELGDVIEIADDFADRSAGIAVFSRRASTAVHARKEDIKDLSDRRVKKTLLFRPSGTSIELLATGEIRISGIQPGSDSPAHAVYDDLAGLEYQLSRAEKNWLAPRFDKAGSKELRASILEWLATKAVPELRKAANRLKS